MIVSDNKCFLIVSLPFLAPSDSLPYTTTLPVLTRAELSAIKDCSWLSVDALTTDGSSNYIRIDRQYASSG